MEEGRKVPAFRPFIFRPVVNLRRFNLLKFTTGRKMKGRKAGTISVNQLGEERQEALL